MSKIIAVDFDGVLCENQWPEIGSPNMEVMSYIKHEQKKGVKTILWTCRTGSLLEAAINWCEFFDIYFDAINANVQETLDKYRDPETGKCVESRKVTADEYIDDKACTKFNLPYRPFLYSMKKCQRCKYMNEDDFCCLSADDLIKKRTCIGGDRCEYFIKDEVEI